jgi:hypothetical protein
VSPLPLWLQIYTIALLSLFALFLLVCLWVGGADPRALRRYVCTVTVPHPVSARPLEIRPGRWEDVLALLREHMIREVLVEMEIPGGTCAAECNSYPDLLDTIRDVMEEYSEVTSIRIRPRDPLMEEDDE